MASLDTLKNEVLKMKTAQENERSKLEAKQAADLATLQFHVAAAEQEELKKLMTALRAKATAMGCMPAEKATMAFKIVSAETLNSGDHIISHFDGFQGVHYKLALPLPSCDDEASAVAYLKGRLREDGKRISTDVAKKLVLFKKTMDGLKGQLIAVVACGKHGDKHGGDLRRVVGDYTYDESTMPGGGKYYHRYKTEFVRKLTADEFIKVKAALGKTPNAKYRLQWSIDI